MPIPGSMELCTGPTLAAMLVEGERLLSGPRRRVTDEPPAPAPVATGPGRRLYAALVDDRRSVAEIAAMARCDPWTVSEHLRNGSLHGHEESGTWTIRARVAAAFFAGRDLAAQRRACGCRPLHLVHGSGRDATDERCVRWHGDRRRR